jgi:hypothetical protein
MRRWLELGILLGGGAWAVAIAVEADLPGAWRTLMHATSGGERAWLFVLFLVPSAISSVLDACAWRATFGSTPLAVAFGRLFGIRLAGEAVNQATPLLTVGGEPVKMLLLGGSGISREDSAASVIASRFILALGQALYAGLAVLLAPAAWTGLPRVPFEVAALVGLLLGVVFIVGWRLGERPRLPRELERYATWVRAVSRAMSLGHDHPRHFIAALLYSLAGWVVVAGEFWLVARALDEPISWTMALALEGCMNVVTMLTFFIPANLGSQEAGLLYLARLAGLGTPFGAMMAVLRRAREIFWIAAGLGSLALLLGRNAVRPSAAAGAQ